MRPIDARTHLQSVDQLAEAIQLSYGETSRLDLTKVINPENKVMLVSSEEHLHALMFNEDKRQIDALSEVWHRKKHKRVVGVLLHYRMLTNFNPPGTFNTLKWIGSVKLEDEPAIDQIGIALERVVRVVC